VYEMERIGDEMVFCLYFVLVFFLLLSPRWCGALLKISIILLSFAQVTNHKCSKHENLVQFLIKNVIIFWKKEWNSPWKSQKTTIKTRFRTLMVACL